MTPVPRLLSSLTPLNYVLDVEVVLAGFTYTMREQVSFTIPRPSDTLVFHAGGFSVSQAQVDGLAAKVIMDTTDQTVTFTTSQILDAGEHRLELVIAGTVGTSLHGLYRSSFTAGDGSTQWLAATQFEAIHAREMFVCIDEPAAKATFDVAVTAQHNLTVLANAAETSQDKLDDGRVRHIFETSPRMSTYLVALVVAPLERVSVTTAGGVMISAYAVPGSLPQLAFALDVGKRCLEFYDGYFATPYPLAKLDMVAIPDFASGAMENWGLVTYRDTALLLDEATASLGNRMRVAEVVAHELAHQWFGNLVTMAWWNDLWLNEGFASWIEVLAQDHLFPEWNVWTQFAGDHYARAMELDALLSTHPVDVPIDDPRALDEIFDAVSYSKGASIIHMLHGYLGADGFRDGLQHYLVRFAYGNATTSDLWTCLEEVTKRPVSSLMSSWTTLPGYPILTLTETAGALKVTQTRFLASGKLRQDPSDWLVPLRLMWDDGSTSDHLLKTSQVVVATGGKALLKANLGQTAFARIAYDDPAMRRLLTHLTAADLAVVDRFGIVSDLYAAAQAGSCATEVALSATFAMTGESSYTVWECLGDGFDQVVACWEDARVRSALYAAGRTMVAQNVARLGWDPRPGEPHDDALMRPYVLQQAIRYEDAAVKDEAISRYQAYLSGTTIEADVRAVVYRGVAAGGNMADFESMLSRYRSERIPQERMRLLGGLCRFGSKDLVTRALELALSDDVRSQDTVFVLAWCLTNPLGRDLAWEFVKRSWPVLLERYGDGGQMLEYIPGYVAQGFATRNIAAEVTEFFAEHTHPTLTRPVKQAVETITAKAAWQERMEPTVPSFLATRRS